MPYPLKVQKVELSYPIYSSICDMIQMIDCHQPQNAYSEQGEYFVWFVGAV